MKTIDVIKNLLDEAPSPRNEFIGAACGALAVFGAAAFGVELSDAIDGSTQALLILPADIGVAAVAGGAFINHLRYLGNDQDRFGN